MAYEYGRYLLQLAKQRPSKLLNYAKTEPKYKSIYQKLTDLYISLCANSNNQEFSKSSLLRILVAKEKLNCLIVNLYPGDAGYTIMTKTRAGHEAETVQLPYEENKFLHYIDNEELPAEILDLVSRSQVNVFYNSCVIVEVRDYRRCAGNAYESYFVLLKPSAQSIISEVAMLVNDSQKYSLEDQHSLESNLLLVTSEPLCLDPSVSVTVISNHLQYYRKVLSRWSLRKMAVRQSQVMWNRRQKFSRFISHPAFSLYDFIKQHKKPFSKAAPLKMVANLQEIPIKDNFRLNTADLELIQNSIKKIPMLEQSTETNQVMVEEYIMEIERNPGKIHCTKVTITQTPAYEQYYGTLCLSLEDSSDNSTCTFFLGSRNEVDKYINQFTEIFTEEGRKSVKTTHIVPGKEPEISFTPGAKEMIENNQSSISTSASSPFANTVTSSSSSSTLKLSSSFTVESIMASVSKSDSSMEEAKVSNLPFRASDSVSDSSVPAIQNFQFQLNPSPGGSLPFQ